MNSDKIILGIDPGTTIMGFGLIKVVNKKMQFLQLNELQLHKYDDHYLKLKLIFERTIELIDTFKPDEIAIEAPFFGKNVQSMLKLGRAQGVAMAAGLSREIPITEYAPKKIKMAITGNGNASKEQVAKMLQSLLQLKELPKNLDSTDGLAAAVCHFYNSGKIQIGKNYTGWSAFVKQNEGRVKKIKMHNLENLKHPIGKVNFPINITKKYISEWIQTLEEFLSQVETELLGHQAKDLEYCYRPNGWNIKQVINHCIDSHINSMVRFKLALTENNPTIKLYEEAKWAELPDSKSYDINESLVLLKSLHKRWVFLLKEMVEDDFKRTFIHPDGNEIISLETNLCIYDWHCKHHLQHIINAKKHRF